MRYSTSPASRIVVLASIALAVVLGVAAPSEAIIIDGGKLHAFLPLAAGQVGRVHLVNVSDPITKPGACEVAVRLFDHAGQAIGDPQIKVIPPGTADFVDIRLRTPVGQRRFMRVEVVMTFDPDLSAVCAAQEEAFDPISGRTQFIGDPQIIPAVQSVP